MKNSDILGTIIKIKLEAVDKTISLLPDNIKLMVRETGKTILTVVHQELGHYLQQEKMEVKEGGLKKVEVE